MKLRMALLAGVATALTAPAGALGPELTRSTLDNGATLLVSQQPAVPMVVVQVLVDAGSRRDPSGKEGVAYLTADLLTEGTNKRGALEIAAAVDAIGASLESSAGVDSAYLSLRVLSKHLATGLDLLADTLLAPSFSPTEIERRRESILAAMKAAEDNPGHVASRTFTETLFAGEPYGHGADGTPESVARLSRADLLSFYREYYLPAATIITVVGDVDAMEIRSEVERRLSQWASRPRIPFSYPVAAPAAPRVVAVAKPIPQANLVMGHRGISRDNPDYYAVTVMNHILGGGGFGSRLLDDIRTAAGLAYSVSSGFTAPKSPGSFRIEMQTKTASVSDAIARACAQLHRMRAEAVTEDELEDAKLYLTGSFPLQFDSNGEIASFLSTMEFFDLGPSYAADYLAGIRAVSRDDVQRVARRYLRPSELLLVSVGQVEAEALPSASVCPEAAVDGGDEATGP